jgi:ribosomal protein S18 acetylase RimI-like enzyme
MSKGSLCQLQANYVEPAAIMLSRAFFDDPLFIYFFPNASERMGKSKVFFQMLLRYVVHHGESYATSPRIEGVAIWLRYGKTGISNLGMLRSGALSMALGIGLKATVKMLRFNEQAGTVHKRHAPFNHWCLQSLGVAPLLQGKGHTRSLLRDKLKRLDREGLACYLDTQYEKNVSYYEKYGFKVVERFSVPESHLNNWAMLRKPLS